MLYRLGGHYLVVDGNHRVSVARYHDVNWIEAEVTQLYAGSPAVPSNPTGTHQRG